MAQGTCPHFRQAQDEFHKDPAGDRVTLELSPYDLTRGGSPGEPSNIESGMAIRITLYYRMGSAENESKTFSKTNV